jgi:tetratricopeptide (TPR) repeat protein
LWLTAGARPAPAEELTRRELYRQTLQGTAWVAIPTGKTTFDVGTAWVIDAERRLLITCYHVVRNRAKVHVLFPAFEKGKLVSGRDFYFDQVQKGAALSASVVDADSQRDLALLQLEALPAGTKALQLAAASVEATDRVHAVGNPAGSSALWHYANGTVRQTYRAREKVVVPGLVVDLVADVFQTQLPMNTGDSGGPVVDDRGLVVGVADSFTLKGSSLATCVDVGEVKAFIREAAGILNPRTADDYNLRGARRYRRGQWAEAASEFSAALRLNAKNPVYHHNHGMALLQQGKHAEARADFDNALRLDPKQPLVLNDRGFVYLEAGRHEEAIADFKEALRLNPKYTVALNNRGIAHLRKGESDKALADFTEALRLEPKYGIAWNNRGFTHLKRGEHEKAIADFTERIQLGDPNTAVYNNRGLAYLERGEHEKAVTDFTEAIRLQPNYAEAYRNRARAHAGRNDPASAEADRRKAAQLDPGSRKK